MKGPGEIAFLVFSGRRDGLLLPHWRPQKADFWIAVDIDFIDIENLDPGLWAGESVINRPPSLLGARVGNAQRWASATPT